VSKQVNPTTGDESSSASTSSVRQRLIRGFGASALGPIVTIIIQVVSVPVFLHFWGAKLYGEWLILSAIPSYLALSDIGFGNVASSDMTMHVAAGRREAALDTFQSTWVLISTVSLMLMALVSACAWFVPWQAWMKLSVISDHGAAQILVVFSAYVLISLQNGILDSAFRCDGNYALGTMYLNIVRFSEAALATVAVACGGRPLHVAITYLCARIVGSAVLMSVLRRKSPWINYGTAHANVASIRRLAAPAFAFMAFPVGNAISLQGLTVVIGVVLGPVAVVAFSTMRTLSRVGFQVLGVIARAVWPELSAAFGAGNISLARKLHRRACQAAFTMSVVCTVALGVIGPYVYGTWTRHAVRFDPLTFDLLLLVILANSFWYTSSVVPMASNQHQKIAFGYMVGTLLSLGLALALMKHFGMVGAAVALLCIDCSMVWLVLRVALRQLSDTPGQFASSMLSIPDLGPMFRRAKGELA
jgi:O-antigen/teichoic acid export membrane protein